MKKRAEKSLRRNLMSLKEIEHYLPEENENFEEFIGEFQEKNIQDSQKKDGKAMQVKEMKII